MSRALCRDLALCLALLIVALVATVIGCSTVSQSRYAPGSYIPAYTPAPTATAGPLAKHMGDGDRLGSREELWVIQRPAEGRPQAVQPGDEPLPGGGELRAKLPDQSEQIIPIPLKHTDVKASIAGYIGTVNVTQQYHNPYSSKIEAVYVFPLPQNAAVSEFLMTIGDRRIRGIIRAREEAERLYQQAKSQGYIASLLTQERPNIFTQSVANIEPGRQIDIHIRYFHTLQYVDGWYEWVFPMVVGPRFNPPGSTGGVGAVARGVRKASGQKTEVQYLRPNERSGHDIALSVDLEAGVPIERIECRSHVVATGVALVAGSTAAKVRLSPQDSIPNKDFVLRYKVAGSQIKSALLTHRDQRGGFFTLMLLPPETLASLPRKPMEMVFVFDCSGSMSGRPIEQAKTAVERALRHMEPADTFQIIEFNDSASHWGPDPVPATPDNVRKAIRHVRGFEGQGGTMMNAGIQAALDFPHDPQRLRVVSFLTDGFIGNEDEILRSVHERLGASRLFSFGVGSAPNRYLLDGLALTGRGTVAYLGLNHSAAQVMDDYFQRLSHPAMTDLAIDFGSMQVSDVFPRQLPDLFVGRPVIVTGRFAGRPGTIRIRGNAGGEMHEIVVPLSSGETQDTRPAIPCVWARSKIADLSEQSIYDDVPDLAQQIKQVALDFGLMSPFTAFVAVDSLTQTPGDHGTTVAVPVPVPEGVRYETTVQDEQRNPSAKR